MDVTWAIVIGEGETLFYVDISYTGILKDTSRLNILKS